MCEVILITEKGSNCPVRLTLSHAPIQNVRMMATRLGIPLELRDEIDCDNDYRVGKNIISAVFHHFHDAHHKRRGWLNVDIALVRGAIIKAKTSDDVERVAYPTPRSNPKPSKKGKRHGR